MNRRELGVGGIQYLKENYENLVRRWFRKKMKPKTMGPTSIWLQLPFGSIFHLAPSAFCQTEAELSDIHHIGSLLKPLLPLTVRWPASYCTEHQAPRGMSVISVHWMDASACDHRHCPSNVSPLSTVCSSLPLDLNRLRFPHGGKALLCPQLEPTPTLCS